MTMQRDRVATVLHALSDPGRIRLLTHLMEGEHRVRDLTDHLHLAQSTVSAHLACLRECGLVTSRPEGRASLHSIVAPAEVAALLDAAEVLAGRVEGVDVHEHALTATSGGR